MVQVSGSKITDGSTVEDSGIGSQATEPDINSQATEPDINNLSNRTDLESEANTASGNAHPGQLSRSGTPLDSAVTRMKSAGSQFVPRSQSCSAKSTRSVPSEPTIALPNSVAKNGRAHTPNAYYGQVIPANLQVYVLML